MPGGQRHLSIVLATALLLSAHAVAAQTAPAPRCGTGVDGEGAVGPARCPQDGVCWPVSADGEEPRSLSSLLRGRLRAVGDPAGEGTSMACVGVRESLGLVRWGGPEAGEGVQVDLVGSL